MRWRVRLTAGLGGSFDNQFSVSNTDQDAEFAIPGNERQPNGKAVNEDKSVVIIANLEDLGLPRMSTFNVPFCLTIAGTFQITYWTLAMNH